MGKEETERVLRFASIATNLKISINASDDRQQRVPALFRQSLPTMSSYSLTVIHFVIFVPCDLYCFVCVCVCAFLCCDSASSLSSRVNRCKMRLSVCHHEIGE